MQKTTRQRVLEIIQRNQALSTHEIAVILGLTDANIRHHLVSLKNDSLIEIVGRKKDYRGRPTHIYGLSEQLLGNGMDILGTILLEEYVDQVSESELRKRLRALATRLVIKIGRGGKETRSRQLNEMTERLNEIHIFTHWQASAYGAQITFLRCPYGQIINNNPQLCILDTLILEEYSGMKVELIEKLTPTMLGTRHCVFQIQDTTK